MIAIPAGRERMVVTAVMSMVMMMVVVMGVMMMVAMVMLTVVPTAMVASAVMPAATVMPAAATSLQLSRRKSHDNDKSQSQPKTVFHRHTF